MSTRSCATALSAPARWPSRSCRTSTRRWASSGLSGSPFHAGQRPFHGAALHRNLADQHDLLGAAQTAFFAEIDAFGEAYAGARSTQAPAAAARQAHQHGLAALRECGLDRGMEMEAHDEAPVWH